ncbi:MAG: type II toxin-antitoxin system YafQ family toxin [Defluviicoccus sp.]|nr:type II toxin-antitoxin system YafQ family toxin [Defluviicoccus sp.]MDE0276228.1 type II toxin-antitoxin system YafQ family toxin [Defluviicoccus sp.]
MRRPAAGKRTGLPRQVEITRSFVKDWERLSRSGRYDMRRLKRVMLLLVENDAPLGPEWRDHSLKGEWSKHRECHIGGDFLLIYRLEEAIGPSGTVVFVRAGTHADLFQ